MSNPTLQSVFEPYFHAMRAAGYHLLTLWLFNCNDLKTMVFPSITFAFFHSIHLCWATWLSPFTINNQRRPSAIAEDQINKPWRPIIAERLTPGQARTLGIAAIPLALIVSAAVGGGVTQSLIIAVTGWMYHFAGGDSNWISRSALNGVGFTSFGAGTLEVALQSPCPGPLIPWIRLIAIVVATTVHVQDMYDQAGDAVAGRKTVPLVVGDRVARIWLAVAVTAWSLVCPLYWDSGSVGYIGPVVLGVWLSLHSLIRRTVEANRTTFRLYNVWLVSLYALPMVQGYIILL